MPLLEELLLGVYLGVVTGILPGLVSWGLAFVFKYFTDVTVPAFGTMVLAVALAGVQGGLMGLLDVQGVTPLAALLVVMMIAMYCHSKGDRMGAEFPRRLTLKSLKSNRLSSDVVDRIGRFGNVELEVVGEVEDVEGYPPLGDDVRRQIKDGDWRFSSELSVDELERRFADELVREFDLSEVSVRIDEEGGAHVAAAPDLGGLSRRVSQGERAVSFPTLVPTGLARGDEVRIWRQDEEVEATVVSASSGEGAGERGSVADVDAGAPDVEDDESASPPVENPNPRATGGEGRMTVAVKREKAISLLESEPERVAVVSRGSRREFELVSLLRSAGKQVRRVTVGDVDDGTTVGGLEPRSRHGVIVLAVKHGGERTLAPPSDHGVARGDELFVVGRKEDVEGFQEVVG